MNREVSLRGRCFSRSTARASLHTKPHHNARRRRLYARPGALFAPLCLSQAPGPLQRSVENREARDRGQRAALRFSSVPHRARRSIDNPDLTMAEAFTKSADIFWPFLFMFSFVAHCFIRMAPCWGTSIFPTRRPENQNFLETCRTFTRFCLLLLGVKLRNKRVNKTR